MNQQEIESSFLGMMMRDRKHLAAAAASSVTPEYFLSPLNGEIFAACRDAWAKGEVPDPFTIARRLGTDKFEDVMRLRTNAPLTQNFDAFLRAMLAHGQASEIKARLLGISAEMNARQPFDSMKGVIDRLTELLVFIRSDGAKIRSLPAAETVRSSLEVTEERVTAARAGKAIGIPTGIASLDAAIYGLQPGFFYVLGARTAVGKTTLACNMALAAARAGYETAFVTVEMSAVDVADKMIAREARVAASKYFSGGLSDDEIDLVAKGAESVGRMPLHFVEVKDPRIDALAVEILRLVKAQGVRFVIVDYLQLFRSGDDKRNRSQREDTVAVSMALKSLALSLNVPILVLSQLNRNAPPTGEPELTHIAESDQIARDADVVMLLYVDNRGDYFISVKKHRRGITFTDMVKADLTRGIFGDDVRAR